MNIKHYTKVQIVSSACKALKNSDNATTQIQPILALTEIQIANILENKISTYKLEIFICKHKNT
jgi:hypothetical protein